jgi:hypothetical protein
MGCKIFKGSRAGAGAGAGGGGGGGEYDMASWVTWQIPKSLLITVMARKSFRY